MQFIKKKKKYLMLWFIEKHTISTTENAIYDKTSCSEVTKA